MHRNKTGLSRKTRQFYCVVAISAVAVAFVETAAAEPRPTLPPNPRSGGAALPLAFEENRGQAAAGVRYLSRGRGYYVELSDGGAALGLRSREGALSRLELTLAGARTERLETGRRLPGLVNYYLAEDRSAWIQGLPTYDSVRYKGAYPGIDVVFYGRQGKLEYDFVVAPAADPGRIRLNFDRAKSLAIADGDLVITTEAGTVRQHKPELYQFVNGSKRPVSGEYSLTGSGEVAFRIGPYDRARELTIDPVVAYSTYSGGGGDDRANGVAVDGTGNAYIVGTTTSGFNDPNVFIQRFNAAGTAILYTSYIGSACNDDGRGIALDANGNAYITGLYGGLDQFGFCNNKNAFVAKLDGSGAQVYGRAFGNNDDYGNAVTVDGTGNAWVTGKTNGGFPVTNGSSGGFPGDAFILELDAGGNNILYATYAGGGSIDEGNAIALDKNGNVWIAGWMQSCDFPAVNGFNTRCAGGGVDGFLAGVNPRTNQYIYTTYIGGTNGDNATGLAIDKNGFVYVTGTTTSTDFYATPGAYDGLCGTDGFCNTTWDGTQWHYFEDAWVVKVDPTKAGVASLVYSTVLGGGNRDLPHAIAVDAQGNVYIGGETASVGSTAFPTLNAFQTTLAGDYDGFVSVLNPTGTALVWSSYLGGNGYDVVTGIALDTAGNVYATGYTASATFPTKNPIQAASAGSYDAFLTKIGASAAGAALTGVALNPATVVGGATSTGTVTLSAAAPAGGAVVALASNSASATVPASVTVPAGAMTATFSVSTTAPAAAATATISATYSGVAKTATLTVNPGATLASLAMNPASVVGGSPSSGTVTLTSAAPTGGAVVTLTSNNTAAATVPASVTVPAGATTATFTASTANVAASTTVTIASSCSGVSKTATLAVNAALSSVALNPATVLAGQASTGTVTIGGPAPAGGAVVTLASSNTAAASVPASVTVPAGATTATFTVTAKLVAASATATVSATYSGSTRTAVLTVNPMLASVAINPVAVIGGATAAGTVTLSASAPAGGIAVALASNNAAAAVPPSVTVPAGATTASFTVTTSAVASNVSATITATSAGASKTAALSLKPWVSSVSMSPVNVVGGAAATGTVTLGAPAPAGGAVVSIASSNAAVAAAPASITIAAGVSTGSFSVGTVAVAANTAVTFTATYSGSSKSASITVVPLLSSVSLTPNSMTGAGTSTGKVVLAAAAPAGGAVVTLASSNTAVATVPASVMVSAGSTSATFSVGVNGVAATTSATVSATLGGATKSAVLTAKSWMATLSLSPSAVVGGATSTATVTLSAAAPAGGAVVALASNNTAVATAPASVTVAAGTTSATFAVGTNAVTANASVTLTATYGGSSKTALLTVMPLLKAVTLSPTSVTGAGTSVATVALNRPAPAGGAVVRLSSSNAAVATVPASVTVAAGATTATFTVATTSVAANTTVTISAALAGATRSAQLLLNAWVASLTLNPASVSGGATSTGTVTLSAPAPAGGATVVLASANTNAATVPASVAIAAGAKTGTFTITSKTVATATNTAITATYGGSAKSATLSVF